MARKAQADVLAEIERARTHGEAPNLRGWNLSVRRLRDIDLTGADLTHTLLLETNLRGANLTNANLTYAWLQGADLTDAVLTNTNLHGAEFDPGAWISSTYEPRQLLNTRGLNPFNEKHYIPQEVWDQILPTNPAARELLEELLNDWDGTLQQAISTAELLHTA